MKTMKLQKLALALLVSLSIGLTAIPTFAAPAQCPSISAIKAKATNNGVKIYGKRYLFRQYSTYNTNNEWEFVVTSNQGTNLKEDLKLLKNNYSTLNGAPKPSEKMGKGTWTCEYEMANHKVIATYPALCSKDLCGT